MNLYSEFHLVLGAEDFTPEQDVEEVRQIEKQVKRRFAIGTQVNVLQKQQQAFIHLNNCT